MGERRVLRRTKSLCPECLRVLDAEIFIGPDSKVRIGRTCPEHGYFDDTYTFSDPELYQWAEGYAHEGTGLENPRTRSDRGCPYDCGLCNNHKSHTVLAIIDVTNRCNLSCPICFANAAAAGYLYEPSFEDVVRIIENLRENRPVPPPAVQFSGGEPTIRGDLPKLISTAKEKGFEHVEVNTNGIMFANSPSFFEECYEAGMDTIYLQFDGLDDAIYKAVRGVPLLEVKKKVIDNARRIGFESIVLVVTLVRGVNDSQVGAIVDFALKNSDVVRCTNFQPVSITGRIDRERREAMRINTSDFMRLAEEQTNGLITVRDFRPVPSVVPISRALGSLKGKKYVEFTTSPHCGVATFLVKDGKGNWTPITKMADVDGFLSDMEKIEERARAGKGLEAKLRTLLSLRRIKGGLLKDFVWPVLREGSYRSLGRFMRQVVMIGCMHFMDPYNFDLQRVERCTIHYGLPDGTIRPFCTYNSLHRPIVERALSIPYRAPGA
jgi:hypothetical protein